MDFRPLTEVERKQLITALRGNAEASRLRREIAAYLRRAINHGGAGARAFGMDREFLPDELAGPAESAALLAVVEQTVADPTLVPDVNWSPELLEWWRGQLARMAEAEQHHEEAQNAWRGAWRGAMPAIGLRVDASDEEARVALAAWSQIPQARTRRDIARRHSFRPL